VSVISAVLLGKTLADGELKREIPLHSSESMMLVSDCDRVPGASQASEAGQLV